MRRYLDQSSCPDDDGCRGRNGLIDIVRAGRRTADVGVLGVIAESTHPLELTDFRLVGWFELSDRCLEEDRVRALPVRFQSLVDEHGGGCEAGSVVSEGERSGRV